MISKDAPTWHILEWQLLTGPKRKKYLAELDRARKELISSGAKYKPIERYSFGTANNRVTNRMLSDSTTLSEFIEKMKIAGVEDDISSRKDWVKWRITND
jgi:protein subunit release factor A